MIKSSIASDAKIITVTADRAPLALLLANILWYWLASPSTSKNTGRQKLIISLPENTPNSCMCWGLSPIAAYAASIPLQPPVLNQYSTHAIIITTVIKVPVTMSA